MPNTFQKTELLTALNQLRFDLVCIFVVSYKENIERVNRLWSTEFQNSSLNRNFTKYFLIEIHVAAPDMEIFYPIGRSFLFAKIIFDIPWFFCPGTNSINKRIWLEKSLEQFIRDLATHKKQQQTSPSIRVDCLDILDKQVEVLYIR
jgi:hypothetical protein